MRPVQHCTWNWRDDSAAEHSTKAKRGNLLRQALLQAGIMVAVGLFLHFFLGHRIPGIVVMSLAGVVLLLGFFLPRAYAKVHAFGQQLGQFVGRILLYLLMVPFFFLFMTPVALVLRLMKRDPLQRKFREARWTYWIPRPPRERDENIDKQFLRESRKARLSLRPVGSVGWTREGDSS